ncbi:MAG: hypothetical protein ACK54H_00005 [Phycisphaerales bacterium]
MDISRFALGAVCLLLNLGACSNFTPATPNRGSELAGPVIVSWPVRDIEVLKRFASQTPRDVFELEPANESIDSSISARESFLLNEPHLRVVHNAIHGNVLLRLWEDRRPFTDAAKWSRESKSVESALGFTPNGSLITSRGLSGDRSVRSVKLRQQALDFENAIRAAEGLKTRFSDVLLRSRLTDGVSIRIPTEDEVGEHGLIFHFHSLHGNPGERAVLKRLQERGWTIVHFQTDSRLATPIASDERAEFESLNKGLDELHSQIGGARDAGTLYDRWKGLVRKSAKLTEGAFVATSVDDADMIGRQIAALTDDVIASSAYAAEGVYLYLAEHRPELLGGPFVLSGFSAGSLVVPAIVARFSEMDSPPRVDAVVLVGSGADLFALGRDSSLTNGGMTVRFGKDKPDRSFLSRVHDSYRRNAVLDPVVTAERMRDLHVLQVHASRDGWVPAECGELLYERLGKPDRLTVYTGHVGLFFRLGLYDDFIADWIDRRSR